METFVDWFIGDAPSGYYWIVIVGWGALYFFSCAPSRNVLEKEKPDHNRWRIAFQLGAVAFAPPLALNALTGKFEELYIWVAIAVYFVGYLTARALDMRGPAKQSDRDFRLWAQILRDGEVQHYFRSLNVRVRLGFALFLLVVLAGYLAIAWVAWRAAHRVPDTMSYPALLEISACLFTGVACWTFAVTLFVSWRALNMHSISFPVRYGFFGNSIHIFLSSAWAALYPWVIFGDASRIDNPLMIALAVVGVLLLYVLILVIPTADWRLRFRDERAHRLRLFIRAIRRLHFATRPRADNEDAALTKYRAESLERCMRALSRTLREIVQFSPFRAFVMLNVKGEDLPIYQNHASATPANPYQAAVLDWLNAEQADRAKLGSRWQDKRVLSALAIKNSHLSTMIEDHRFALERADYRYRMMYWIQRLMEKAEPKDHAYLHPLTEEALADVQELEAVHDRRSALLATAGAGVVSLGGFLAAVGREVLVEWGEDIGEAANRLFQ